MNRKEQYSRFLIMLLLLVTFTHYSNTQAQNEQSLEWNFLGPVNFGGPTPCVLIDQGGERIYAGAASGGLWLSTDRGIYWKEVNMPYPHISCMTQASDGTIYVGTGNYFDVNSGVGYGGRPGNGIYKSTDGKNFTLLTSTKPVSNNVLDEDWVYITKIQAHPQEANTLYVGTNRGLWYSTDGGSSWQRANNLPEHHLVYDLAVGEDGRVHVLIDNEYFYATDGLHFIKNASNEGGALPITNGRKSIVVAPSNSNYVYAVFADSEECFYYLYQSKDGGENWKQLIKRDGNQFNPFAAYQGGFYNPSSFCMGGYAQGITVHPSNPEKIYLASNRLYIWEEGIGWTTAKEMKDIGNNNTISQNYIHSVSFHPSNEKHIYLGTDIGIFRTINGRDFSYRSYGFCTAQTNGIDYAADSSTFLGAANRIGIQEIYWDSPYPTYGEPRLLGNGINVYASRLRPNMFLPLMEQGQAMRTINRYTYLPFVGDSIDCFPLGSSGSCFGNGIPDNGAVYNVGNAYWEGQAPHENYYFTGDNIGQIWMTNNVTKLTPDSINIVGTETSWWVIGTLMDVDSSQTPISTLTIADDGQTLWAGNTTGALMRITQLQDSLPLAKTFILPALKDRYITAIEIAPNDPDKVLVTLGGYGYNTYLYGTSGGTADQVSFKAIQNDLPAMPLYDIIVDQKDPNFLIAATDKGIYTSSNNGLNWQENQSGMGLVPISRLKQVAHPFEQDSLMILAATYGKGYFAAGFIPQQRSITTTELTEASLLDLIIQPNLSATSIQIHLPNPLSTKGKLSIFNANGQMIEQVNASQASIVDVEVNAWEAGLYWASWETTDAVYWGRFVVVD